MKEIIKIQTADDYCRLLGVKEYHSPVVVIDYNSLLPFRTQMMSFSVFAMFFHASNKVAVKYGSREYHYHDGYSLSCIAPGQIGGREDDGDYVSFDGWALIVDPSFLRDELGVEDILGEYAFFHYAENQALVMTRNEYLNIEYLLRQLAEELNNGVQPHRNSIIAGYIKLILAYAKRFYARQKKSIPLTPTGVVERFHLFVRDWFANESSRQKGLPSVQECAESMSISVNRFSNLIKQSTGDSPGQYIKNYVVILAKELLLSGKTIAETAFVLRFEYPQHFSRLFKQQTGMTPRQYVASESKNK